MNVKFEGFMKVLWQLEQGGGGGGGTISE